jgi:hypothetical protein
MQFSSKHPPFEELKQAVEQWTLPVDLKSVYGRTGGQRS